MIAGTLYAHTLSASPQAREVLQATRCSNDVSIMLLLQQKWSIEDDIGQHSAGQYHLTPLLVFEAYTIAQKKGAQILQPNDQYSHWHFDNKFQLYLKLSEGNELT
jgi:hypothetical protein